MDKKQEQSGRANNLTRRKFIHNSAAAAAGITAGLGATGCVSVQSSKAEKPRSYNPEMEYRPLGKTGISVSAVCLGGHWKRVDKMVPGVFIGGSWLNADLESDGFRNNRRDVVTRCIEHGINYIDACTWQEIAAYSEALRGRRDAMHLGFSWYQEEMRNPEFRTVDALLSTLDKGMSKTKLDYVDVWRITMYEQSGRHTDTEVDQMMGALEKARKQGKVRFTGLSSHDRKHIKKMIETYPEVVQVVVTPYTAKSKLVTDESGLWATLKKYDVGWFGIKPFAGTSLFKGNSAPDSPTAQEDDRLARLAIQYILRNSAITAPIPGMINTHQVDNVVKAVKERHQLDVAEVKELQEAMDQAWANLPAGYLWLKNWEYV